MSDAPPIPLESCSFSWNICKENDLNVPKKKEFWRKVHQKNQSDVKIFSSDFFVLLQKAYVRKLKTFFFYIYIWNQYLFWNSEIHSSLFLVEWIYAPFGFASHNRGHSIGKRHKAKKNLANKN